MQKSLVDLSEAELLQVKDLASLFFTPKEISVMMEVNLLEQCCAKEPLERFQRAYEMGRLQAEVDLRTSIMKLAKSGSSPAQTMALDLLNKSKLKLLDR